MKIAYLHRLTFEESEKRFLEEAAKLGIELVLIKYRQLKLVGDRIFYQDVDLADFNGWYFRSVGNELEWAKLLEMYAKKHHIPVVDEYLIDQGPLRRFKSVMGVELSQAGINYPKTTMVENLTDLKKELKNWSLPLIIKLSSGGRHGMSTFWIRNWSDIAELEKKLTERKENAKQEGKRIPIFRGFLVQEFIKNDGDFRVMVIGVKCIGGFKRQPKEENLVMNKSQGKSVALGKVPLEVAREAEKASQATKVEIAGLDLVRNESDGKIYVIEINEAPQFKVFEKRTGINAAGEILAYIKQKCQKQKCQKKS